jgi:predicted peroxiredoxin
MRKSLFTLILAMSFFSPACQRSTQAPAEEAASIEAPTDGVFIHISHGADDAHRVLMALSMANKMADEDRNVLVYFDITGVQTVLKDAPDLTMEPFGSSRALLGALREKGVTVMACPGCLEAAGKSEADLMEGVVLAEAEPFFSFTDGRILSLDY